MKRNYFKKFSVLLSFVLILLSSFSIQAQETWTRLTNYIDATPDGVYIIVATNKSSILKDPNASSQPLHTPMPGTISNDGNTFTPSSAESILDSMKWKIVVTNDTFTIIPYSSPDKYLYCINNNNGVRVGTPSSTGDALWTSHQVANYKGLKNTGRDRYIGVYIEQDWRSYTSPTSDNIRGTNIEIFKLVSENSLPVAAMPTINVTGISAGPDSYYNEAVVTLSTTTDEASIYYTTDGSTPTAASNVYTGPFTITESATIKAIAIAEDLEDSNIVSKTIEIVIPSINIGTLPYSESFNNTLGDWTNHVVSGNAFLGFTTSNTGATVNGYNKGAAVAYLISPKFTVGDHGATLFFNNYSQYAGDPLQVVYSTNYIGYGDPTAATWESLATVTNTDTEKFIEATVTGEVFFALIYNDVASPWGSYVISNLSIQDITVEENVPVLNVESFTGTVGISLNETLTGEYSPINFTVVNGELPNGITLAANGLLSGIATEAGIFSFEVVAENTAGISEPVTITITIAQGTQTFTEFADINAVYRENQENQILLPLATNQGFDFEYTSTNTDLVSIEGNVATIHGIGSVVIAVNQTGNENWLAIDTQIFTVTITEAPVAFHGKGVYTKVSEVSDITTGYYVITNETSAFLMSNVLTSNYLVSQDVTGMVNGMIVNPSSAYVWKIEKDGNNYTIYNEDIEKYVAYTGSSNTASLSDVVDNTSKWTITKETSNPVRFTVKNVASNTRQLSYNSGSPRFACYANANQQELQFYKLSDEFIAWVGEVNSEWTEGYNWSSNSVPTTDDAIVVANSTNNPVISTIAQAGSITVAQGAELTITASGNLLQSDNAVNSGVFNVTRETTPLVRQTLAMWSSPVQSYDLRALSGFTLANRVYYYDGRQNNVYVPFTTQLNTYMHTMPNADAAFQEGNEDFVLGRGYFYRVPNTFSNTEAASHVGTFTGVANNGEVSGPALRSGFHSLGNPYPSTISAQDFIALNAEGVAPSIYGVWGVYNFNEATQTFSGALSLAGSNEPGVDDYTIEKGNGFLVWIDSNPQYDYNSTQTYAPKFDNSIRNTLANANGLVAMDRHRYWLNLAKDNTSVGSTLVAYMPTATNNVDGGIELPALHSGVASLYSVLDNGSYIIQGRALPFENSDVVNLGFRTNEAGTYSISIPAVEGLFSQGQEIILVDNLTQTQTNISNSAYEFVSEAGEFNGRFQIVYRNTLSNDDFTGVDAKWIVSSTDNRLTIQTAGVELKSVEVFDLLGRSIYSSQAVGNSHQTSELNATQVLIVKVTTNQGQVLTKKVLN